MARLMTLSDDEIETIRIHLSAIKEELCNQGRYGEAAYYEKLIEKFLSSNVIRCKKCKHYTAECGDERYALGYCPFLQSHLVMSEGFCAWAERKGDLDAAD